MEALNQLDIQSPDHVTVITRDGKMTVSVVKDGASITVSMPVRTVIDTTPRPPAERPAPKYMAVKSQETTGDQPRLKPVGPVGTTHVRYRGPIPKLDEGKVREIKMMLSDKDFMKKFGSRTKAYREIGKAYEVTGCTVSNIDRGISWRDVTV